ncbi:c-type cytochrome [Legionella shakespearei]|uniref:Cytochrome c5 n=1 Tax=Legionella shakespearei DSM 23087 TaxID=1122169 RepID=A0A0W0Z1Z5_9GAMM|nr:c-type cytochrome [Legionella shakespearei]KTD62835.1 cytochrome c5 [Legionella shakespearei DSM 23087]
MRDCFAVYLLKSLKCIARTFGYIIIVCLIFSTGHTESHHPQDFLKSIKGAPDEGEQIYNHFCVNCHALKPLIPLGAPRKGELGDWKERLKQGFDVLFKHTDEGFNAMPARGGCFECTDEQLGLSIITMVPKEAQKDLLNALRDYKKYKE